jgi:hypothetical protein
MYQPSRTSATNHIKLLPGLYDAAPLFANVPHEVFQDQNARETAYSTSIYELLMDARDRLLCGEDEPSERRCSGRFSLDRDIFSSRCLA